MGNGIFPSGSNRKTFEAAGFQPLNVAPNPDCPPRVYDTDCAQTLDVGALSTSIVEMAEVADEAGLAWDCSSQTNLAQAITKLICDKALQIGDGVPDTNTPSCPPIYFDKATAFFYGYAEGAWRPFSATTTGGGGGDGAITNVERSGSNLVFTGTGTAFSGSVPIPFPNAATMDIGSYREWRDGSGNIPNSARAIGRDAGSQYGFYLTPDGSDSFNSTGASALQSHGVTMPQSSVWTIISGNAPAGVNSTMIMTQRVA